MHALEPLTKSVRIMGIGSNTGGGGGGNTSIIGMGTGKGAAINLSLEILIFCSILSMTAASLYSLSAEI